MTTSRFLQLGGLLAAMCLASAASATPFLSINFNGDTVGLAPTTSPAAPLPRSVLSYIGGYTASTTDIPPTAANGTTLVGSADEMAKGVIMTTNPANGVLGALWLDNLFNVTGRRSACHLTSISWRRRRMPRSSPKLSMADRLPRASCWA